MNGRLDCFVGAMTEHGGWLRLFVVGIPRLRDRAVRELPATTITGRRARTAEFDETPHAVCRWQSRPTGAIPIPCATATIPA